MSLLEFVKRQEDEALIHYRAALASLNKCEFQSAALEFGKATAIPQGRWGHSLVNMLLDWRQQHSNWPTIDSYSPGSGYAGSFKPYVPPLPLWDGDPTDKKLLLLADQGAGECVMFLRYIDAVRKKAPNVAVMAVREMHRIIETFGVQAVEEPTGYDICWPMMLIPRYTWMNLVAEHYLKVPKNPEFVEIVGSFCGHPRIGVCWSGNPHHPNNAQRSVPPEMFDDFPMMYNLQYGQHRSNMFEVNALMTDFMATAQLIQEMDIVISVSTSVAVIAAAMGKETWVLLDAVPYWMWGLDERTRWFPCATLYRQTKPGDWSDVIQRVKADAIKVVQEWPAG